MLNDIQPSLTDQEIIDFCVNGYIMLEGVIPDETNRRTFDYLNEHPSSIVNSILDESFFVNEVLLNPAVAGAVRSLLGKNFGLPHLMVNHRAEGARKITNGWHMDAGSISSPPSLFTLQVFYYPQDTPMAMGPTALLPGTHLIPLPTNWMCHFGNFRNQIFTAMPAGSVFITAYPIWHRATDKPAAATRNLLKYNYWRTVPPERDWVIDPNFDPHTANYKGKNTGWYTFNSPIPVSLEPSWAVAEMYYWLCGKLDEFKLSGGQGFPLESNRGDRAFTHDMVEASFRLHKEMKDYKPL
ncbi:hypothetical protein [Paenibacillus montanisoli]|uniref:Phytanoyl-CoA dioxygenase n=1 Tax=Paenibacillus montanisoli TaxID=2081970 RepID=A0A328U531_9BACL|nr:hypothetical protein [Paenibacillus montanisoli]RAP77917.1 hypothetical protein DL346_05530 [Paenibacillus montanisoli]